MRIGRLSSFKTLDYQGRERKSYSERHLGCPEKKQSASARSGEDS